MDETYVWYFEKNGTYAVAVCYSTMLCYVTEVFGRSTYNIDDFKKENILDDSFFLICYCLIVVSGALCTKAKVCEKISLTILYIYRLNRWI